MIAMAQVRTHYELLDVEPGATPHVIRAAYIDLMKRCHPNSPYRGKSEAVAGDVHAINLAYSVLKDPAKRAAYDAEIRGGRAAGLPARGRTERRMPTIVRKRRPQRRDGLLWLIAGIGLAAVIVQRSLIDHEDWRDYRPVGAIEAPLNSPATPVVDLPPPRDTEWIKQQARLAATMAAPDATAFSALCFKEAREVGTPTAADQCIVFDLAYSYWREGTATGAAATYFHSDSARGRHSQALAELGQDQALLHLETLRSTTFSALLEMVGSPGALADDTSSDDVQPASDPATEEPTNGSAEVYADKAIEPGN